MSAFDKVMSKYSTPFENNGESNMNAEEGEASTSTTEEFLANR